MATEVKHGPIPVFETPLTGATFMCEVVGRYTKAAGLGAGGVTVYRLNSENPAKRRAELLVLRTAFLEWFREMYEANGGSRIEAAGQVRYIADGGARRLLEVQCGQRGRCDDVVRATVSFDKAMTTGYSAIARLPPEIG